MKPPLFSNLFKKKKNNKREHPRKYKRKIAQENYKNIESQLETFLILHLNSTHKKSDLLFLFSFQII